MGVEYIYLLTPQHTGTWFTIAFLMSHPEINGFVQVKNFEGILAGKSTATHPIISKGLPIGMNVEEKIVEGLNILQEHPHKELYDRQLFRAKKYKTIVTLRRVEHSFYSRERRHPELSPHRDHLEGWLCAQKIVEETDPFLFPVDLYVTNPDRKYILKKLLSHVGLPNDEVVNYWVDIWPDHINKTYKPPTGWEVPKEYIRQLQPLMKRAGYV